MAEKAKEDELELPLLQKKTSEASTKLSDEEASRKDSIISLQSKPKYLDTGIINKLLFYWVGRIIDRTGSEAFQQNFHYDLRQTEECEHIANRFFGEWEKVKDKRFPLLRAHYGCFRSLVWLTQFFALANTLLNFTGPLLVSKLIAYTRSENPELSEGLYLIFLFIITRVLLMFVGAQYTATTSLLLARIVKATRSLIFAKFLKFPLKRNQEHSSGSVMNNMLVDADNMSKFFSNFPELIQLPVMFLIGVYMIYISIGFAFISVALTLTLVIYLISLLTKSNSNYLKETMKAKDVRIKRTNEIFNGIKYIKMCGTETKFLDIITKDRDYELSLFAKRYLTVSLRLSVIWLTPTLLNLAAFGTYLLFGDGLTSEKAFFVVSTLMVIQVPIFTIGTLLNEVTQSQVSLKRIQDFLSAEEVDTSYITRNQNSDSKFAIKINDGNFAWVDENLKKKENLNKDGKKTTDPKEEVIDIEKGLEQPKLKLVLKDINMKIKKGSFVAILGDVGSGKSSLFHALFGEMRHEADNSPSIKIDGTVAYVSQKPWILNDTVKGNILFYKSYDQEAYNKVVKGSCLEQDLMTLVKRDETEIGNCALENLSLTSKGEKGVNLSGGQKARVALARAVYADKDIYLLDDPLSAVDAHVGRHILEECLAGQLKNKTRVLVTHKLESLRYVDYVYIFKDRKIVAEGNQDTIRENSYYQEIEQKSITRMEESQQTMQLSDSKANSPDSKAKGKKSETAKPSSVDEKEDQKTLYDKLMLNEDRKVGSLGLAGWKSFFSYFGDLKYFILLFGVIIFWILLKVAFDFWLAYWSTKAETHPDHTDSYYYGVYVVLGLVSGAFVFFRINMVFSRSLKVNRKLHNEMFQKVIRAPVNLFFDRVPLGRLINRFSTDLNTFDFTIPFALGMFLYLPFNLLSRFLICAFAGTMWVFPLAFLFFWIGSKVQKKYLDVYRETFRLSRITETPVTSLFTESLDGLTQIRSSCHQGVFMRKYYTRQNEHMKNQILISGLQGWFNFRVNLASLLITGPTIAVAILYNDRSSAGDIQLLGLLITYLLDLNFNLIKILESVNTFESNLVSFERCKAFTEIEAEKDPKTNLPLQNYSGNWPEKGRLEFKGYYTKYRPTLPYVLKDVSFSTEQGEKIGVVGRTGSGKSTLFLSILRILEAEAGSIYIDNVDISQVGLDDLRQKITVIPQDPLLYKGTVKHNLDLLDEYREDEIWKALEKVRMKNKLEKSGLSFEIKEGGENLSAGEKQLLCIARAILKKNKIILIDEATSSIDNVTEEAILEAIHENFKDCTVITVAHRLKTIISSDRILFMENGQVMEFDTPENLLGNSDGHFYQLWSEYQEAKI